jgi:hypothetical protein
MKGDIVTKSGRKNGTNTFQWGENPVNQLSKLKMEWIFIHKAD